MEIIPAIDILDGQCVRLFQGNYNKKKIYNLNPIEIATRWEEKGANILHIVDLNGAKDGNFSILKIIKTILNKIHIPIQIGGGIRSIEIIKELIDLGVDKIILGTLAYNDIDLIKKIVNRYNEKIIISIDLLGKFLMQNGWVERNQSKVNFDDIINMYHNIGINQFIYTDTKKDGTLSGPNFKMVDFLRKKINGRLIVAGGVSDLEQLLLLKKFKVDGVIIGKALYENTIDFKKAIDYVK